MSTTKKKKSAREKRVLVAAIICAGLIVAGSTFAWFQSTDEVTNRLTANADYGVSIVESFTPPENWLPGQDVNKDVYAVNTGNIAALVKEDVSGVLTVTYEQKVSSFPVGDAAELDLNTLDSENKNTYDESTSKEAGAFLAWNSVDPTLNGYINTVRPGDASAISIVDFKPTQTGDYVFRRSIKYVTDGSGQQKEEYTYVGYHFENDKYYKIEIDKASIQSGKDGILSTQPTISYFRTVTDTAKNVSMLYDENSGKPRLVVNYKLDPSGSASYDANAMAARIQVDIENATAANDVAKQAYNDLNAIVGNINDLIDERNEMIDAAKAYKEAVDNMTTTAGTTSADLITLSGKSFSLPTFPANISPITNSDISTTGNAREVKENSTDPIEKSAWEFNKKLGEVTNTTDGYFKKLEDAIAEMANGTENLQGNIDTAFTDLSTAANALYQAYDEITSNNTTALSYGTGAQKKQDLEKFKNDIAALQGNVAALKAAYNEYIAAKAISDAAATAVDNASTGAKAKYEAAVEKYNSFLNTNSTEYDKDIYKDYKLSTAPVKEDSTATPPVKSNQDDVASQLKMNHVDSSYKTADGQKTLAELKAEWDRTQLALENANKKKDELANSTTGNTGTSDDLLTIYINLDPEYAANWYMMPEKGSLATSAAETVSFYYKKVLEAGVTSEKLIDSVTLADQTKANFKDFTFDLNVALKSVQVSYDTDTREYTGDSSEELGRKATISGTTVNWGT